MKIHITRISVHNNAKIIFLYFSIILSVFTIMALINELINDNNIYNYSLIILFWIQIIFLILSYIISIIVFTVYNFIARHSGGIEFENNE